MATLTKTASAQPAGAYVPTTVDAEKAASDIQIIGHSRRRTVITSRKLLSGAGVKCEAVTAGVGRYLVTDEALDELRRRYRVVTDF